MSIQFPPINPGDPDPVDGDTYLYIINQQEYVCRRRTVLETPQWSAIGFINTTSFGYRGTVEIQQLAPTDANKGNIYSVIDGGIANTSFDGLAGQEVQQYSLIIFDDPEWIFVSGNENIVQTPWVRTVEGEIKPAISTDDLNMDNGNIQIQEFPEL